MFTGAMSANLYGVPRATDDADLVVSFEGFDVAAFVRELGLTGLGIPHQGNMRVQVWV